jgi:hypothetical protein
MAHFHLAAWDTAHRGQTSRRAELLTDVRSSVPTGSQGCEAPIRGSGCVAPGQSAVLATAARGSLADLPTLALPMPKTDETGTHSTLSVSHDAALRPT